MKDGKLLKIIKKIVLLQYIAGLNLMRSVQLLIGEPRYYLRGVCKCCGACCESPMIQINPIFFRLRSVRWLILAWHQRVNGFEFIGQDRKNNIFIFRCTHYDPVTKLCDSYESRPGMCWDYPKNLIYSIYPEFLPECGYYAVDKKADKFRKSLEQLNLPPEKLESLLKKLHLKD